MAGVKGKSGKYKDKPWTDALRLALNEKDKATGLKKLRRMADAMVERAIEGDTTAAKEIGDRLEGKPAQAIVGDNSRDPITLIERVIIG